MLKAFNFKRQWFEALARFNPRMRAMVYDIILDMAFNDADIPNCHMDSDALALLMQIRKVIVRRRVARERAAVRREQKRARQQNNQEPGENGRDCMPPENVAVENTASSHAAGVALPTAAASAEQDTELAGRMPRKLKKRLQKTASVRGERVCLSI